MSLLEIFGIYIVGYCLGWAAARQRRPREKTKTASSEYGDWRIEIIYPESAEKDALRWQREIAHTYLAAKNRGMVN